MQYSLLAALSLALSLTSASPIFPRTKPTPFILSSTSSDAKYNDLVLTLYHIGAAEAYAQLLPPGPSANAIPWTLNNTALDFDAGENGEILEGIVVTGLDKAWQIDGGYGTKGFCLEKGKLKYEGSECLYACTDSTLPYGPGVQVFANSKAEVPSGCAEIELKAKRTTT
ncbi:MAG: hypothetical protein MMC23_006668 [Stictis urceolatum]|nr:hypothetical protein [Stictis urceolata]